MAMTSQKRWPACCYNGHAKQALAIASQCRNSAYMGRFIIVVDDDIDPSNTDDVLWALTTRCDPALDIDVLRNCWRTFGSDHSAGAKG